MFYSKSTTNASFLNMWHFLQRKRILNNIFMLQTRDKKLNNFSIRNYIEMDFESPEFQDLQDRIVEECSKNIWFYFREIAMIPDYNDKGEIIYKPFQLTEESMAMIYLYDAGASFILQNSDEYIKNIYRLLWHRHHTHKCDDLQITVKTPEEIKNEIKRAIELASHSTIPYNYGRGSLISVSDDRCVIESSENLLYRLRYESKNPVEKDILLKYKKVIPENIDVEKTISLFDLAFSNNTLLYTLLFHLKNTDINWNFYFVDFGSIMSADGFMLRQWAEDSIPKFTTELYDSTELNKFYFI